MSSITSGAVSGEERHAYAKLEALKDIRSKTLSLEKLRQRLFHDVESVEGENHCLKEYKKELDLLLQEKMAHVAELRQIHADINAMETVIKQSEEARRSALDSARRVLDDYAPLKHEVDIMRTDVLGLEKLPDLAPEDKDRLSEIGVGEKPKQLSLLEGHPAWHHPGSVDPRLDAVDKGNPFFFGRPGAGPHPFLAAAAAQHTAMGLGPLGLGAKAEQLRTTLSAQAGGPPVPPPFRQQPPPMKNCMSCHQQIHRNAPICPLCKAKSRSRNPKKPKKKD